MYKNANHDLLPPMLILDPIDTDNKEAHRKQLDLIQRIKVGRITGTKTLCHFSNGYFDSKVLSRHHAELWSENGKVYIQDVGSSNGTFINGSRLSEEGLKSPAIELQPGDRIDFGVDIWNETENEVLFKKVSVMVDILSPDASMNASERSTEMFLTLKTESKGNSTKGKSIESSQQPANKNKRMQQDQPMHSEVSQMSANLKDQQRPVSKSYQEPLLNDQLELLSAENQNLHKKVDMLMDQIKSLQKNKNRSSTSSSSSSYFTTVYLVAVFAFLLYFFVIMEEQERAFWIRKVSKKVNKLIAYAQNFFMQQE
ncbi:hypothetical protein HMI54_007817 [Coelomomyces lativittatus]|nr:hypothetical protein HMI54_007817 [Coelomomyces lativittatus]KAJ1504820.1 hypothetical protein HMI56_001443 [Coelomomyces lativittatus]KAJ1518384.1 hypothetical protein HMI55_005693 [Coelomomyces lativittatus]